MNPRSADPSAAAEPVAPPPEAAERLLRDTAVQGEPSDDGSRAPDVERDHEHPTQRARTGSTSGSTSGSTTGSTTGAASAATSGTSRDRPTASVTKASTGSSTGSSTDWPTGSPTDSPTDAPTDAAHRGDTAVAADSRAATDADRR
jgi:hypothetical protein